jgi:SAM-dependent methyltransferase
MLLVLGFLLERSAFMKLCTRHSALTAALLIAAGAAPASDVPYVPTPPRVVAAMIRMAEVGKGDVVYDLGCGDGRIVIAALKAGAARGVCVEIDPARIEEARVNARRAKLEDRIRFMQGDLFLTPIADATVVTLYLLPAVNLRLKPRLLSELRPGARVVSHDFDMGDDWKPEQQESFPETGHTHKVFRWTIPERPGH